LEQLDILCLCENCAAASRLLELRPEWQAARTILFFASVGRELGVCSLFESAVALGKKCAYLRHESDGIQYLPRLVTDRQREMVIGSFDIGEPRFDCPVVPWKQLDLVLVPGLAFDLRGHRLGRGKGIFDRVLAEAAGVRVGVAHDFQVVEEVPVEPHDMRVHFVLTPTRWLDVRRGNWA
jgi:5-formyltetrahydrofolate cyclo-ligase